MASIVTRAGKGSALTVPEMDQNFKNLDAQVLKTDLRPLSMPVFRNDIVNSGVLDPRVTFSRASPGTYFDKYGVMRTAAAGVPRIDHDPITSECRGLLVEEQRTNYVPYSNTLQTWSTGSGAVLLQENAIIAPDSSSTATKFTPNTSTINQAYKYFSYIGSKTISIYAKYNGYNLLLSPGIYDANRWAVFDLLNGVILNKASNSKDVSILNIGNGWYRCSCSSDGLSSNENAFSFVIATTDTNGISTNASNGTSGIYIWGAQLEAGSAPSSYIPTTTAAVTRAADVVKIPVTASKLTNTSTVQIEAKSAALATNQNYCSIKSDAAPISHKLVKQTQSKNLLINSEKFDQSPWTVSAATVTNSTTVNPLTETLTVKKIVDTIANSAHYIYYNVGSGLTINTPYTYSVYAKASGRDYFALRWNGDTNQDAIFNLTTGAVVSVDSAVQATMRNIGNGWYRCAITVRPTTASSRIDLYTSANSTLAAYAGDAVSGTLIFGAQLEAEEKFTKYVPEPGYAIQVNAIAPTQVFGDQVDINKFDRFAISTTGTAVNYASNGKFVGSENLAVTQITDIVIGADSTESAQINGHIQKIAVYNSAASQEQLVSLTI